MVLQVEVVEANLSICEPYITCKESFPIHYSNEGFADEILDVKEEKPPPSEVKNSDDHETKKKTGEIKIMDKVWPWFVCFAGFLVYFVVLGIHTSFGKVFDNFLKEFKESHSKTAWIGSAASWALVFFAGTASYLCGRLGCGSVAMIGALISGGGLFASSYANSTEMLYLTYSLAFGFGTSLSYTTVVLSISEHFDEKRSLALGLTAAGSSTGTMIMSPIIHYLFVAYGWRISFRILSGFSLLIIICGLIMKPKAYQKKIKETALEANIPRPLSSKSSLKRRRKSCANISILLFDYKLLKSRQFLIWLVATIFTNFGYYIPHTYMILYATSIGISSGKASTLFIFFGIFSTIGRIFGGTASSTKFINSRILIHVCMFLSGTSSMFVTYGTKYYFLACYTSLYGFLEGSIASLVPIITLETCDLQRKDNAWGTILFFGSFSLLLGPPTAGWLYSYTKSFQSIFYLNAFPMVAASFLVLVLIITDRKNRKNFVLPLKITESSSNRNKSFGDNDWIKPTASSQEIVHMDIKSIPVILADENDIHSTIENKHQ